MKSLFFLFVFFLTNVYSSDYNRKEWKHWIDEDKDCLNTRNEILKDRSLSPAQLNAKGCSVLSGEWEDYYYNEKLTDPKKIDIDHLIPLKNAHISGGESWSSIEKKNFANDLENLVITYKGYNRKKGSKGIDEWLPLDKTYACKYVRQWIKIKSKYNLQVLDAEKNTIFTLKKRACPDIDFN